MSFKVDNQYISASLTGALRGITGFSLEHPFDCVKTCWQAEPHLSSAKKVARHNYEKKGVLGFYAGAIPNGTRMVIKQAYRFPMMMAFPKFYRERLPENVKRNAPFVEDALTGISIATLESGIITPLERMKVVIMTSEKMKRSLVQFIARPHLFQEAYRGFSASYLRQLVTWSTFSVSGSKPG